MEGTFVTPNQICPSKLRVWPSIGDSKCAYNLGVFSLISFYSGCIDRIGESILNLICLRVRFFLKENSVS